MLKIEKTEVVGWEAAIRGMRNPMNSWEKSDSGFCDVIGDNFGSIIKPANYRVGPNDYDLMTRLRNTGTDHRKFMRMLIVYLDITAPLYWWKEFKTYRAGRKFGDDEPDIIDEGYLEYDIEMNSCSTMHKIAAKEFTLEDFSCEHLSEPAISVLKNTVETLNQARDLYLGFDGFKHTWGDWEKKHYWWQMIQLLPSSYNQKRTVMLSYEVLANIYKSRKNHKLDEWHTFCDWIEGLPYSELITGGADYLNKKLRIPVSDEIVADTLRKLRNPEAASPDESKAILLDFYEKMRKGAPSTPTKDLKIIDEWNQYGHVDYIQSVKSNCEIVTDTIGKLKNKFWSQEKGDTSDAKSK